MTSLNVPAVHATYGPVTAGAVPAQTFTYTGSRGNGIAVLWVGAWVSKP